jgi:hypothetical protein
MLWFCLLAIAGGLFTIFVCPYATWPISQPAFSPWACWLFCFFMAAIRNGRAISLGREAAKDEKQAAGANRLCAGEITREWRKSFGRRLDKAGESQATSDLKNEHLSIHHYVGTVGSSGIPARLPFRFLWRLRQSDRAAHLLDLCGINILGCTYSQASAPRWLFAVKI